MTAKTVRIIVREWLPKVGDRDELLIKFEVVNDKDLGKPDEVKSTFYGKIVVGISRTLQRTWNLKGIALEKVLVDFAKKQIHDKLIKGSLGEEEEFQLSDNAPEKCPFDTNLWNYYRVSAFKVVIPDILASHIDVDSIADRIVDLRDRINAIFGEKFNGRLLTLPQERSLSILTRKCESEEEFAFQVSSLCGLATAIDANHLIIPPLDNQPKGSIDKFSQFIRYKFPDQDTEDLLDSLAKFNHLRRMYPIHTDRATGVVKAYAYFGIDYPPKHYQEARDLLLHHYLVWLEKVLNLLRTL